MVTTRVPGRVDPAARRVLEARWRTSVRWLRAAVVLCAAMLGCTVVATVVRISGGTDGLPLLGRRGEPAGLLDLGLPLVLAVGALGVGVWLLRRAPGLNREPESWVLVPSVVGLPLALAVAGAGRIAGVGLPASTSIALVVVLAALPAVLVWVARRALLFPLVPELGGSEFVLSLPARAAKPSWWSQDVVGVDGRELSLVVRTGAGRAAPHPSTKSIELHRITGVGVRSATGDEGAWAWLSDGRGVPTPPGEVVVVRTAEEEQLVPVDHAAEFAALLRWRVRVVAGRAPAAIDTDAPQEPVSSAHAPEVLPAPEPVGERVAALPEAPDPVGADPGMVVRWLGAGTASALGIVVLPLLLWWFQPSSDAPPELVLWRGVLVAGWVFAAAVCWVVLRTTPRRWPWLALVASAPAALTGLLVGQGLVVVLAVAACAVLAFFGGRMLTGRAGADLASSDVELPVRLDAQRRGRLLIGRDRVVLDRSAGGFGGHVRQALPLAGMSVVQAGRVESAEPAVWPLPGGEALRVRSGPGLRLVSGQQQWIVPLSRPERIAEVVRGRAARARPLQHAPVDLDQWRSLRTWAVAAMTSARRGGPKQGNPAFRVPCGVLLAMFGTLLGTNGFGREMTDPVMWGVVAVSLLLAGFLLGDWLRIGPRLRRAEENPLPPGSPAWGELRADHAPVASWRPWQNPASSAAPEVRGHSEPGPFAG